MKNFLIGILIIALAFCLCGCGGDKSETSAANTSGLEQYVTNSDEVTAIIQERFGTEDLTYEDVTMDSNKATLSQFGNGNFAVKVNGINVTVNCYNHLATRVHINTGAGIAVFDTPSYLASIATSEAATTTDPNSDTVSFMGWNS